MNAGCLIHILPLLSHLAGRDCRLPVYYRFLSGGTPFSRSGIIGSNRNLIQARIDWSLTENRYRSSVSQPVPPLCRHTVDHDLRVIPRRYGILSQLFVSFRLSRLDDSYTKGFITINIVPLRNLTEKDKILPNPDSNSFRVNECRTPDTTGRKSGVGPARERAPSVSAHCSG